MKTMSGEDLAKHIEFKGRYVVVTKRYEMLREALKNKVVISVPSLLHTCVTCLAVPNNMEKCELPYCEKIHPKEMLGFKMCQKLMESKQ